MKKYAILLIGGLGWAAAIVLAQGNVGRHFGCESTHPPRLSRIMALFDTNNDGKLDAHEIANAPFALKALDKNGDGELTADELCGSRLTGERPHCATTPEHPTSPP